MQPGGLQPRAHWAEVLLVEHRVASRIGVLGMLIATTALVAACSPAPSHEDLNSVLDAYPLPQSFEQVSEREYTFGDGPLGDEANAVARYFDVGDTTDPRGAIIAAADGTGVVIEPASEVDLRLERISTTYRGTNVVIFIGSDPIEVRAYGPVD